MEVKSILYLYLKVPTKKWCSIILFLFLQTARGLDHDEGTIRIGAGLGIQSYPSAIDPYQLVESIPVLYPEIEMTIQLVGRIGCTANVSRSVIDGSLLGAIYCPQRLELFTSGCGLDYNFGTQSRAFRIGFQMLAGFGEYGTSSDGHYYGTGWGVTVFGSALRKISQHFAWGMRTGVQRLKMQGLPHTERVNLDSFYVEAIGYFVL